jgi:hypothetical protein
MFRGEYFAGNPKANAHESSVGALKPDILLGQPSSHQFESIWKALSNSPVGGRYLEPRAQSAIVPVPGVPLDAAFVSPFRFTTAKYIRRIHHNVPGRKITRLLITRHIFNADSLAACIMRERVAA